MIGSDRLLGGKLFICLCVLFQFCTVSHAIKCIAGDGRQGLCVVKRFCREATQHELLPCEGDRKNHCCPIPTTHRSAQHSAERPRHDERLEPKEDKGPPRERDDRLNKTPPPGDRRSPTRPSGNERPSNKQPIDDWRDDYDRENRRQRPPQENAQEIPPNRPSSPTRPSGNERPSNKQPIDDWRDDYDRENRRQRPPQENAQEIPPNRPSSPTRPSGNERPSNKQPIDDWRDDYDRENRRQRPPQDNAQEIPPNRPRPHVPQQNRPEKPSTDHDRRDSIRRPESDRVYPARDDPEFSGPPPPRRVQTGNDRVPPKSRDDSAKQPITFPERYEFSVPRPRVPACGVKPYELFIAGGEESQQHEWPWMTAIFRRHPDARRKTFLCGGSLINTKYVLTAAHCFVNNYVILPASSFIVRLGSHFLDSGEEYTVSNLVIHHNHSGSDYFNDIALVRLASEVYVTDKIAPICLPSPDMMDRDFVGSLATVCGWGDTAFRSAGSRVLQHVIVPIVTSEECSAAYSRVSGAAFLAKGSEHIICAGLREGGKDACLGDSGGPLMVKMSDDRWIIVGIVSLGYKCAEPGYPGVYTRVTHYMSWIGANMKKH